jgi:hypothetical protein
MHSRAACCPGAKLEMPGEGAFFAKEIILFHLFKLGKIRNAHVFCLRPIHYKI